MNQTDVEIVIGDGKDAETLHIGKDDLALIKGAIESTANAFKKWKELVPVFLAYEWAGAEAFEDSDSEERKRLHRFIKMQSKDWSRAELELERAKNAQYDDKKAEHKALAGVFKARASTVATVAVTRMVKYYQAEQAADDDGERGPRGRKSPRQKIEAFIVELEKFSNRDLPKGDKRIAREAVNALRVVLAGQGVSIPVFSGMPNIPEVAQPQTVGAEQRKAGEVTIIKPEPVEA